jgi:hypothetical protein
LRYQYRQLGKPIVDVSRYDNREVANPHQLLGNLYSRGSKAHVDNSAMSFRAHHYVGSWETFRSPGYDKQGVRTFEHRNKQDAQEEDDTMRPWLSRFVDSVGTETAFAVTEGVRCKAEWEMKQILDDHAKGNHDVDWSKLDYDPDHPFAKKPPIHVVRDGKKKSRKVRDPRVRPQGPLFNSVKESRMGSILILRS